MLTPHLRVSKGDIGRFVLLPGDPARVDAISKFLKKSKLVKYNREFKTITGYYYGIKVSAVSTGIGAPAMAIAVEELASIGAKVLIRVGSCGALEGEKMIEIENLTHVYENGVVAVKELSLRIKENEVVGIIGQNGSGKTTLVKHLNALLKPTKGRVIVNGIAVLEKEPYEMASLVGYIFQNPDEQIFSKTIEEEVGFGVRQVGKGDSEWALKTMGLWRVRKKNPYDFSYNLRKLVGIASIIAMRPKVIIFDEPTTGQDPEGVVGVEKLVEQIRGRHTIIVISHDIEFIARNCERVVLMDRGKKIFDGKTREVLYENIEKYGIEPPQIVQLSKKMGLGKILTVEEAYEKLMGRKSKKSIDKIHKLF